MRERRERRERRVHPHWKTFSQEEGRRCEARNGASPLANDNLGGRASTFFFTNFPEDVVKIKVDGACYKVTVVEDPLDSLSLGPKKWEHVSDQSTEAEWTEEEEDVLGDDEHAVGEDNDDREENRRIPTHENSVLKNVRKEDRWQQLNEGGTSRGESPEDVSVGLNLKNVDHGHIKIGPQVVEPSYPEDCIEDPSKGVGVESGKELPKVGCGEICVPDLNNSPQNLGLFPFVNSEDSMDEDMYIRDDEDLEQAIADEIDRKKRHRKKGFRKSQSKGSSRGDGERSNRSGRASASSFQEEVNQTIRIGEELGIQFNGNRAMIEQVLHREGAAGIKW
ncbi:hypothetical protein L2E82_36007 [Cichorium intybus]|uniref:Uncharacterized protein n=1 Tax=Cichorium intybus TaxID=13427 RepID=A0ACB9BQC6_CICIN|nr:hypothetical protein L2E82_36007 [Cichorium intybus]